jgi:thiamine kinase-like enzyme
MLTEHQLARRALMAIPGLAADASSAKITRLKGLTNRVYKVGTASGAFSLRIPGEGTAAFIDRSAEETNARAAAQAGVAPQVLHFGSDGVMVTRFIEGAVALLPERFRDRDGAVERVARTLRRLHSRAHDFSRDLDASSIVADYVALLGRSPDGVPPRYREIVTEAAPIRDALAAHAAERRPCHGDPTGPNLLDTGEKVWLIDWEYSGMNDPMWDLAYLSLEAAFDGELDERLLRAYFGRPPSAREAARMAIHKPLCELISALWALVQDAGRNSAAVDFAAYADAKLRSAHMLLRSATPRAAAL